MDAQPGSRRRFLIPATLPRAAQKNKPWSHVADRPQGKLRERRLVARVSKPRHFAGKDHARCIPVPRQSRKLPGPLAGMMAACLSPKIPGACMASTCTGGT